MTAAAPHKLTLDLPRLDVRNVRHLLVVDDDADIREMVATALTGAGYTVTAANSGQAALAAIDRRLPDLVVLDVAMPGMTGLDVCRALRTAARTEALPIIMLTAQAHVQAETEGLIAGADIYLTKPFSPKGLVAQVDNLLSYTD